MKNILLTGASGFVGSQLLCDLSKTEEYHIYAISREDRSSKNTDKITWLEWSEISFVAKNLYAVVNLMGENIASSWWTEKRKEDIFTSRVDQGIRLIEDLKKFSLKPKVWIQASAIGYYGYGAHVNSETDPKGEGFLADICGEWEGILTHEYLDNIQKHTLRIGVVVGEAGGMIAKIKPIFNLGLGGKLGDGQQNMSWIAVEDLSGLIEYFLNHPKAGIYNAVAPEVVSNEEFTEVFSNHLNRPAVFPVPKIMLKTLLGDMSHLLLDNECIKSKNLGAIDYVFKYPTLKTKFPN